MKIQKGGIILVAPDGEDLNQFKHQTRSRDKKSKSPTKFLSHVDSPCRVCPKKVTDENSITCDKCQGWVHLKCSNLTKHEFEFLCNSPQTKLKYFCSSCENKSPADAGSDPVLIQEARLDALDKKFDAVELQNKAILDLLKKDEKKDDTVAFQATVQEVFDNSKEKDEKKNNLILFNLPETTSTDEIQSQTEDLQVVKEVLKHVNGGVLIQNFDESNVSRMGRKKTGEGNRPRAIKIQFTNVDKKMKILKNAKLLAQHDTFKKLGLSTDKTEKEREEHKTRRREVSERNAKGEDLIIYRDKIMKRSERPTYHINSNQTSDKGEQNASPTAHTEAGISLGTPEI